MAKTYILQKDLPDSKAGDKYIWMETGVPFDAYYHNGNIDGSYWLREHIENNIEWFKEYIPKKYTEEDMRKCFNAGNEVYFDRELIYTVNKYKSFNDYLKTL